VLGGELVASETRRNFCAECLGDLFWDPDNGEQVCGKCGTVSPSAPDLTAYVPQPRSRLESAAPVDPMKSIVERELNLSTLIDGNDVDARGKQLASNHELKQLRRLNTIVSWDSSNRRLARGLQEIERLSDLLGVNDAVAHKAYEIYQKSFSDDTFRARSLTAVAAASVFIACRDLEVARPSEEALRLRTNVNEKKFRHYYRNLLSNRQTVSIPNPVTYVSRIASRARLSGKTERRALEILDSVKGNAVLAGKRPISIAAAALYLASLDTEGGATQLRIAAAAEVTPITIRKRSLEISTVLKERPTARAGEEKDLITEKSDPPVMIEETISTGP
jgi:transcription initiation factor TFIIB